MSCFRQPLSFFSCFLLSLTVFAECVNSVGNFAFCLVNSPHCLSWHSNPRDPDHGRNPSKNPKALQKEPWKELWQEPRRKQTRKEPWKVAQTLNPKLGRKDLEGNPALSSWKAQKLVGKAGGQSPDSLAHDFWALSTCVEFGA